MFNRSNTCFILFISIILVQQFIACSKYQTAGPEYAYPKAVFIEQRGNGFRTWDLSYVTTTGNAKATEMFFVDSAHGWIFDGERLMSTSDAGKSWESRSMPRHDEIRLLELIFENREIGWMLVSSEKRGGDQSFRVTLYRTSDGGKKWNESLKWEPAYGGNMRLLGRNLWIDAMKSNRAALHADEPLILVVDTETVSARDVSAPLNALDINPANKDERRPSWSEFAIQPSGCVLAKDDIGLFARSCDTGETWNAVRRTGKRTPPYNDSGWDVFSSYGFFSGATLINGKGVTSLFIPEDELLSKVGTIIFPKYIPRFGFATDDGRIILAAEHNPLRDFPERTTDIMISDPSALNWHLIASLGDFAFEVVKPAEGEGVLWLLMRGGRIAKLESPE
ncbi:MAG: hypothetical protein R2684_10030 [Pyrinomonadaceae bacterium]